MGRAAFRALAVCVVLLVPGPRTASPEAPRPFRTAASSLVLRPTPRPALPQVVEPPPFLVAQAPRGARLGISSPTGVPPSGGTRARIAGPGSAQTARRPRPPASAQAATQYTVVEGDSLWSIARRFGTTVEALVAVNGISEADFLQPGQVLRVPTGRQEAPGPRRVFTYTVRQGDTLWAIALKTGVRVEDLAAANGIQGDRLRVGQKLVVPAPLPEPAPGLRVPRVVWRPRPQVAYLWPARGVVTSRFGARWRRHHTGVDIAAPRGTPIHAARDGRVVRAGWYAGYGLVVVLDHGDGMETWYGHASAVLVRVGQEVRRGQVVARVGCTGACTGPHVHFEVRVRGEPVNPLRYLP